MKVGVTVTFKHSVFSAGSPQVSLTIAELYSMLGHTVTFIRIPIDKDDPTWWDDITSIKDTWKSIHYTEYIPGQFDLVFEIEHCLLPVEKRVDSNPHIWVVRKSPLFHDIEKCVTPHGILPRNLTGISESWILRELSSKDDIEYIELITRKPVKVLPFVWSPLSIEVHNKESMNPIWHATRDTTKPYVVSICEKNTTSTSSCAIPLMSIRQIIDSHLHNIHPKIHIYNGNILKESKFFVENVLNPALADVPNVEVVLEGRCRLIDLTRQPNTVLISHSRFITLRNLYLDCLWTGIPLIHNMKLLCELGEYVTKGYYENNDILGATEAFTRVIHASTTYTTENLLSLRRDILLRFGLLSETLKNEWNEAAKNSVETFHLNSVKASVEAVVETPVQAVVETPVPAILRVGFCDMWTDFNPTYNFFTLLLEHHLKHTNSPRQVIGVDATESNVDIVIFGPFGIQWTTLDDSIPKVHYTGENTPPIVREDVVLNLGYMHSVPDIEYLRFPLWLLEIDWFNADVEKLVNPKPIPIMTCLKVEDSILDAKDKFCSFIVSNPSQPARNDAFKTLNRYKHIDSGGRLFNNIGNILAAGHGGGGGELKKHEFLKSYKFSITYENKSSPGYMTEKLLHAKAAGCVPIYWGDSSNQLDFDMEGCIDARGLNLDELTRAVIEVDSNPLLWRKKASIPALDKNRFEKAVNLLRECATRILGVCSLKKKVEAKVEAKVEPTKVEPTKVDAKEGGFNTQNNIEINEYNIQNNTFNTYFITGCNNKFFKSLIDIWLPCIQIFRSSSDKINATVALFDDVTLENKLLIMARHPWVRIISIPKEYIPNFPDAWNPQHFLWKLWLYRKCVQDKSMEGSLCIYIDTGVFVSRWPTLYVKNALKHGVSVLSDPTQINKHWCHSVFNSKLDVKEAELNSNQIWAGACAFVSGHPTAVNFFTMAYEYGCDKEIIIGNKWTGIGSDGKPYGHRHDQSILSILALRMDLHRTPLYSVYNDVSIRNTFLQKKPFYVYRTLFREHVQLVEGIDDAWLINLDRRPDRLEDFNKMHPDIEKRVIRIPAIDGKQFKLTPNIARLFASMPISTWMKGAMGCAMSHMIPWLQLANEKDSVESYLIVEDDAVLNADWNKKWAKAYNEKCIPSDYDIVYLGGILPPNKMMFETAALDKINNYIGKIKPNKFFGQSIPNPYFHVTTCSYVLSKKGAEKLLNILEKKQGCFAHLDHFMCGSYEDLNIYFFHPLIAHAKQDSDPKYANSQFNDLSKIEAYDSDIRDGTTCSREEIESVFDVNTPLDVIAAIIDARKTVSPSCRVLSYGIENSVEGSWIKGCLLKDANVKYELLPESLDEYPFPDDTPTVVYDLGNSFKLTAMLKKWSSSGKKFNILHIGDAVCMDPIDIYSLDGCISVVRNYVRSTVTSTNVLTLPLGYQYTSTVGEGERDLAWAFMGTNWHNRKDLLQPFIEMPCKNHLLFVDDWSSPEKVSLKEMFSYLTRAKFVPCPSGENPETFRMYEALEAGAVPVLVKDATNKKFLEFITENIPIKVFDSWDDAAIIVYNLANNATKYKVYRNSVLNAWITYKNKLSESVKRLFQLQTV
jgi:GR25 family glycosyltransferase involved in LPS biosynthesis